MHRTHPSRRPTFILNLAFYVSRLVFLRTSPPKFLHVHICHSRCVHCAPVYVLSLSLLFSLSLSSLSLRVGFRLKNQKRNDRIACTHRIICADPICADPFADVYVARSADGSAHRLPCAAARCNVPIGRAWPGPDHIREQTAVGARLRAMQRWICSASP